MFFLISLQNKKIMIIERKEVETTFDSKNLGCVVLLIPLFV